MIPEELVQVPVAKLDREYKSREKLLEARVKLPLAIRLDGVGFSKALIGFAEPRDVRVHKAIVEAASEIVKRFSASGAYVASDEINVLLLGPPPPYAGRLQKLVSISAALASSSTSLALGRTLLFDARVVPLEGVDDAKRYVLYRARIALNNYVGRVLRKITVKSLKPPSLREQLELLRELGINIGEKPVWEWAGSSIYWSVSAAGKRVLKHCDGPDGLLKALERYRSPELSSLSK